MQRRHEDICQMFKGHSNFSSFKDQPFPRAKPWPSDSRVEQQYDEPEASQIASELQFQKTKQIVTTIWFQHKITITKRMFAWYPDLCVHQGPPSATKVDFHGWYCSPLLAWHLFHLLFWQWSDNSCLLFHRGESLHLLRPPLLATELSARRSARNFPFYLTTAFLETQQKQAGAVLDLVSSPTVYFFPPCFPVFLSHSVWFDSAICRWACSLAKKVFTPYPWYLFDFPLSLDLLPLAFEPSIIRLLASLHFLIVCQRTATYCDGSQYESWASSRVMHPSTGGTNAVQSFRLQFALFDG